MRSLFLRALLAASVLVTLIWGTNNAKAALSPGIPLTTPVPGNQSPSAAEPNNVHIEVSSAGFSVTWETETPIIGWIEYGVAPAGLFSTAFDIQGTVHKGVQHRVLISDLDPGTTYYFVIGSGNWVFDDDSQPYSVTTFLDSSANPGSALPLVRPISLPVTGLANGFLITDEQYLSGFSLDIAEIQSVLDLHQSPLAQSTLTMNDGAQLPTAEAISFYAALYTVSPSILLSLADAEFGLLTQPVPGNTLLDETSKQRYSEWFARTAEFLAISFYQVYNAEAETLRLQQSPVPHINAGTYAIDQYFKQSASNSLDAEAMRSAFIKTHETYFGRRDAGQLHIEHPEQIGSGTENELMGSYLAAEVRAVNGPTRVSTHKFPWTGNDQWNYNSGPHPSGTGATAYSSLDFQPGGMNGCNPMVATGRDVRASASGRVISASGHIVTLDHDLDGNRYTGWQTQYVHLANIGPAYNTLLKQGNRIGNPACIGNSSGVHVHYSLMYKSAYNSVSALPLSGWSIVNGSQSYHGYMQRPGYPGRQSGFRPGGVNYDAADTVLISDNCGLNRYFAEYYSGRLPVRYPANYHTCISSINFNWGGGGPGNGIPNDNFSARWLGAVPLFAGRYTFTATADDGVRLWVNGNNLVDAWIDQPARDYSRSINLTSGEHTVEMEYYENGGGALARLTYTRSNGTLHTLNPRHSNKCLDIRNASTSNFAVVQQYSCNRTQAQMFYIVPRSSTYFEIRNQKSGKCLDLLDFSTAEGAPVVQYSCHGGANQQWQLAHAGRSYYFLKSRHSGKCLAVPNGSGSDTTQIKQYTCQPHNHQLWTVNW